jgi:capsular polysaccharide transport system permease protein
VNKHVNAEVQIDLRSRDTAKKLSLLRMVNYCFYLLRNYAGFIVIVVAPTAAAAIYYGVIAAPIYVSTAQFVVKNASQSSSSSGLGQFLQSAGLVTLASDAYAVGSYITSRDALAALEKNNQIRSIYDRPEADFVARFPNFYTLFRPSFEYLFWHYSYWIEADFDSTTNITTIYAYAFRPEDAQTIAGQLLSLSESAVNRMNDRAKLDTLRAFKEEVDRLQQREDAIETQITAFRNTELILDPDQASTAATALRSTLENALVAARALLDQLQQTAPGSPQIAGLRMRIKSLEDQASEQERKDSGGVNTLAPKMARYTQLLHQQQFAQQMLQAAVSSYETAEVNVQQQLLFIQRIAEPRAPDWPQYPYRILNTLLAFVTALLI